MLRIIPVQPLTRKYQSQNSVKALLKLNQDKMTPLTQVYLTINVALFCLLNITGLYKIREVYFFFIYKIIFFGRIPLSFIRQFISKKYSRPCQTSKMEFFSIFNI